MENNSEIVTLLKSIELKLNVIAIFLGLGVGLAFNAGYRADAFGWIWGN